MHRGETHGHPILKHIDHGSFENCIMDRIMEGMGPEGDFNQLLGVGRTDMLGEMGTDLHRSAERWKKEADKNVSLPNRDFYNWQLTLHIVQFKICKRVSEEP
jgi:hypothetical protein